MNYDNKTLEKSLENLVKPILIRRELYAKLDTALIQSIFFQGSITKLAIYNAKKLLDFLVDVEFEPFSIDLTHNGFFFAWGSNEKACTPCAFSITVEPDIYTLRVYDAEIVRYSELVQVCPPKLNEIQLENFKEMLGLTKS